MFRIKFGPQITIGNVSRGAHVVLECEHINEVVELIESGVAETFLAMERECQSDAPAQIRKL